MEAIVDCNDENLSNFSSINLKDHKIDNDLIISDKRNKLLRKLSSSSNSSNSSIESQERNSPKEESVEFSKNENIVEKSLLEQNLMVQCENMKYDDSESYSKNPEDSQDSQLSFENDKDLNLTKEIDSKSINFKPISNGSIPKSGKPMMLNKKVNKPRGRPKRKELPVYQSQISDNKFGIKLCIKKSDVLPKSKSSRKRKSKQKTYSDSEGSDYEKRKKRDKNRSNSNIVEPVEQSGWGNQLPEHILLQIFSFVVKNEGTLPSVNRLGRVCKLWNRISTDKSLWKTVDLSNWTKEKHRTELKLKYLIENRLHGCIDLNLANWKVTNTQCVMDYLLEYCPNLEGISLSGWKEFTPDHLLFLVEEFTKLKRIDLSSINFEMNTSRSALALNPLCNAVQIMADRLTHLNLAHNRLAGIPQLVITLSTHCPNLLSLDLSNVTTVATSHGILHIEKLQSGCPKLKVLLITNSHITLSTATLQEQMDSLGFPDLEELSVASLADESRLINDEYLQRILKTSTKLKLLDVRGCARLTHDSLIRLPAWDLKHLFLSGCSITRDVGSGLELIASKWAHSLTELDLAWANVQGPLDSALRALAEKGKEAAISHINLCGSSVSLEAVKELLKKCPSISSINLSSCRGLPRGVKRLLQGTVQMTELKENLGVIEKSTPVNKTPESSSSVTTPTDSKMLTKPQDDNLDVT